MVGLLETLTLALAPAIAKAILKFWLRESSIAQDVTSDILDLIRSKTDDVIAQQRAKRQFEEIGARVVDNLIPIFQAKNLQMNDISRNAVAIAVTETINKARIQPNLLLDRDLDPTRLANDLIGSSSQTTQHFSDAERQLFDRAISEASQCIVDISSQLPSFNEITFAEILKREGSLIIATDRILKELQRIQEESQRSNPREEAASFEVKYRQTLLRKLDQVELLGVDLSSTSSRYRLSTAYVSLSVEADLSEEKEGFSSISSEENTTLQGEEDEVTGKIVSVDEVLTRFNRLLVVGLAGSGKTTLLNWIAVNSASRSFEEQLSDLNSSIPFFIPLRHCIESGLPSPEQFPRFVTPSIAGRMPEGWVHDQLESGRAIVLVDGVDEMPQLQRIDACKWLKELMESYPNARYIATSRPYIVLQDWIDLGLNSVEIQPMDLMSVDACIDHWHGAVREGLREEESIRELEYLANDLKNTVRSNHPIRILATNPLLCAMLCALHRDRRGQIPRDRIELYEACCYMLLERRDVERRIDLRDYPQLSYRQKRVLLQDIAYYLLVNGWSMAPQDRIDDRLTRRLANMDGVSKDVNGSSVRRLFVERGGVIREPMVGQLDFTHRTFQEFFAAQAALDEGDIGALVKNAHDDLWREVVVLAAGLANLKERNSLIRDLISRGDGELQIRH